MNYKNYCTVSVLNYSQHDLTSVYLAIAEYPAH